MKVVKRYFPRTGLYATFSITTPNTAAPPIEINIARMKLGHSGSHFRSAVQVKYPMYAPAA